MLFQGLLSVAVIATFGVQSGQAKYDRLNNYLLDHVKDDNVVANLDAAANGLKEANFFTPTKDFQQFVALKELIGSNSCDKSSLEIMAKNVDAVDLFRTMRSNGAIRRVDKIIQSVFSEQVELCQNVYMARWRSKSKELDETLVKKAQIFADKLIYETLFEQEYRILDCESASAEILSEEFILPKISLYDFKGHHKCPRRALAAILGDNPDSKFLSTTPDERTGKLTLDKTKLDSLVEEHLIAPCHYYVEQLGPNLFDIADLYKAFFNVDEKDRDFYSSWATYKICELFSKNKSMLSKELRKHVEDPSIEYQK